jgi:hypothetical protein
MAADHEFVASAITRLGDALAALAAPTTPGLESDLAAVHGQATALQANVRSTTHADSARAAFVRLASLLAVIQSRQFPDRATEVSLVPQAAKQLDPDRPLLEQREAVQRFLDRSADALRGMVAPRAA